MPRRHPGASGRFERVHGDIAAQCDELIVAAHGGGPVRSSSRGRRRIGLYCAYMLALASSTFPMSGRNRWATSSTQGFPFVQPAAVGHEIPRMQERHVLR
jgi:hypothetical protein